MNRKRTNQGKRLKRWFNNHPVWVILSIVLFILTLTIAIGTVFSFTTAFIQQNIAWKSGEQSKIDSLAPTQTVEYFNSVLGEPNVKSVTEDMTRYIYKERGYWVEVFSDKNAVVQMFNITACGDERFYPKVKNNPIGPEIILGKTKMRNTTAPAWRWKKEDESLKIHYFLRGASAPSYYYDEYYAGNPGNYQTVFSGHNELCGYLKLPKDIDEALYASPIGQVPLSEEQVSRLRLNTTINTFGITSPNFDLKVAGLKNVAEGGMGVSYVDEGVLLPSKQSANSKDAFSSAHDFEVIKF